MAGSTFQCPECKSVDRIRFEEVASGLRENEDRPFFVEGSINYPETITVFCKKCNIQINKKK